MTLMPCRLVSKNESSTAIRAQHYGFKPIFYPRLDVTSLLLCATLKRRQLPVKDSLPMPAAAIGFTPVYIPDPEGWGLQRRGISPQRGT